MIDTSKARRHGLHHSALLATFLHLLGSAAQECPPVPPVTPPWLEYPSEPFRHVAFTPSGDMTANVYLMDTGVPLGRPFVFVEGIDFGLGGTSDAHRFGDFGWDEFLGCAQELYPMMGHVPVLIDSLLERGFHPVLVDFQEGAGDIFSNAALLADILQHLAQYRNDPRYMVVSGASMGGQIARIALRMMESSGVPHCCQLYLSLDSPHQGANVPLGLQQTILHLASENPDMEGLGGAIASPAARQLLLHQAIPGSVRTQYQDSLDAISWPVHCRNAAIANGGTEGLGNGDQPLLDYEYAILPSELIGDIGGLLDLEIHPHPGSTDHPLAGPLAPITSLVETPQGSGWPWPLELAVGLGNPTSIHWPNSIDLMPGGTRPSVGQFVHAFNQAVTALELPWPIDVPAIVPAEFQPLHSFIPTPSALGIALPWSSETMGALNSLSPFDAIHHGLSNEPHSEVNPANVAFVLNQLDLTECPLAPGFLAGEHVLNASGDWGLPSLAVAGRLCLQSSDPVFGTAGAPSGSVGWFEVHPCAEAIEVMEGGMLELGGGPSPVVPSAHLTLQDHTMLRISGHCILHENSTLTLEAGSRLVLAGGTLDMRTGSRIHAKPGSEILITSHALWTQEPESEVILESRCLLEEHAHWLHFHTAGSRMRSGQSNLFVFGEDSHLELHGPAGETHWVLGEGTEVWMEGDGAFSMTGSGIRWMGQSLWNAVMMGGTLFSGAIWVASGTDSMVVSGELTLLGQLSDGLHIRQDEGQFRMEDATLHGGSTTMLNNRVRWNRVHCSAHPVSHLGLGDEPTHLIASCRFEDCQVGLQLRGPGRMRIEDSGFNSNGIGLHLRHGRCEAACCTFTSNDIAIHDDRALLIMQPEGGGGWNEFNFNDVHLHFNQALPPEMLGGANHFGSHYSGWASGNLDFPCSGGPIDWLIHGQSWDWPDSWPQIQGGLWTSSQYNGASCPVVAVDLNPIPPRDCGQEGKKLHE